MPASIPDALLDLMAERFRMLADPTRLAIVRVLLAGERNVGQLAATTGHGQANVSKHLKMLADAGMVRRRKAGLQVFYSVSDRQVETLCTLVSRSLVDETRDLIEAAARPAGSWQAAEGAVSGAGFTDHPGETGPGSITRHSPR